MNLTLFKDKNFTLVILGKFISLLGTCFQEFALSLYILAKTGSGKQFASVLAIAIIPKLILGPIAGVFADWLDRKKIIVCLDFLSGIIVSVFCVIYIVNGELSLPMIYILVLLLSIISAVFNPAMATIIPTIVDKDNLGDANSINSLSTNITTVIAPIVAGIVFGIGGILPVMIINAMSFILSGISELFIILPKANKETTDFSFRQFSKDFLEGLYTIKNNRDMIILLSIGIIVNFSLAPLFTVAMPFILKEKLLVSDFMFGIFESMVCIGPILASLFASKIIKKNPFYKINTYTFLLSSLTIIFMSLCCLPLFINNASHRGIVFILLIALSFITVAIVIICNISVATAFQKTVDIKLLGRVISVWSTIITVSIPIGQILIGSLLDTSIDIYLIVLTVAILLLISGILNHVLYSSKKSIALEK